jgi:vacuolar-type H+-ATPase catalytic subunit A/Vma1
MAALTRYALSVGSSITAIGRVRAAVARGVSKESFMKNQDAVIRTIAEMIVDIYIQQRVDHDEDTESEPEFRLPAPALSYIISTQAAQYGFDADNAHLLQAVNEEFAHRDVLPIFEGPE